MLQFQPPGFGQRVVTTALGVMTYYTPMTLPWRTSQESLEAAPPLVFLHSLGGGSSAFEWSKVYPALASDYRIIAPDLVGWGQSAHPIHDYQIEDYFNQITALIEQTHSTPATVFASSLTAGIVIRLANQRPELFKQLFLVAPAGYADFGRDYAGGITARMAAIPGVDRFLYSVGAANEIAVRAFLEQVLFAQRSRLTSEIIAAYLTSAQQRHAEYAALSSLRGDLCFDLSLHLPQLMVPTHLIWGEQSKLGQFSLGKRLKALNPKAIEALHCIPDAGALPHLERPEQVLAAVLPHLR